MGKLLKRTVDALLRRGVEDTTWDGELRGFGLRIRGGRGVYVLKYRFHGRQRWYTLGGHGELTPARARVLAADLLAKVRSGVDPAVEKKASARRREAELTTFASMGQRYISEGMGHLAPSTREDQRSRLRPGGPLLKPFGAKKLSEIGRPELLAWWSAYFEQPDGLARKTGRNYLDTLGEVFAFSVDRGVLPESGNPIPGLRVSLRRRARTKGGRAENAPGRHANPIESPDELGRLLVASAARPWIDLRDDRRERRGDGHMLTLLLLDAGLRLGEAIGLRWGDVRLGSDAAESPRELVIRETLARGRHRGVPKSGRERTVALSRRLRSALRDRYLRMGCPDGGQSVLPGVDPTNYRKRHFARACSAARIGERRPKDLRDTFASQLLTAGIPLGYISAQLGHADVAVTAKHYARWAGAEYRHPLAVAPGEVPADLLARLTETVDPGGQVDQEPRRSDATA